MRINKYKELINDNEIKFLMSDIKEDFTGFPVVKKTVAKYILLFNEITEEDTLLTIYNFISTNELKIKIKSQKTLNYNKAGIEITLY